VYILIFRHDIGDLQSLDRSLEKIALFEGIKERISRRFNDPRTLRRILAASMLATTGATGYGLLQRRKAKKLKALNRQMVEDRNIIKRILDHNNYKKKNKKG